jgi:hypothetical protein
VTSIGTLTGFQSDNVGRHWHVADYIAVMMEDIIAYQDITVNCLLSKSSVIPNS